LNRKFVMITKITDHGDVRGHSYPLPSECMDFLGHAVDLSMMTLKPGYIRGNHFHIQGKETLVVIHRDQWSFYWDDGVGTEKCFREFKGEGVEMIEIKESISHAVKNDGGQDIYILHLRNYVPDPSKPDTVQRVVT
jgi:hypothetical protein